MLSLLLNIMIRRVACDPTDQDAVWGVNSWGGAKNHALRGRSGYLLGKGTLFGGGGLILGYAQLRRVADILKLVRYRAQ